MQSEKLYLFEGVQRTMLEIARRFPVLSRTSIRKHLAAGRTKRQLMLCRDSVALRRASGKRNDAILKSPGRQPALALKPSVLQGTGLLTRNTCG